MLESLVNPKRVEKGPWKMFFIGILYASLSLLLVHWFFSGDMILARFSGMIVVAFCVMFSLPFFYFIIRKEEKEDEQVEGFFKVWRMHKDAIYALMWLFLGFVVAFSFWNIVLGNSNLFNAQVGTYCMINSPSDIDGCLKSYSLDAFKGTGAATKEMHLFSIVENNVYVMIFTLLFSLIFGAGAIFILSWNASVIAAAVGIFAKYKISGIPAGLGRYMLHGIPEVTAYFITALAGGMFGVGAIRHGFKDKKFLRVVENVAILLFFAIVLLIFAALIEVYITPLIFG